MTHVRARIALPLLLAAALLGACASGRDAGLATEGKAVAPPGAPEVAMSGGAAASDAMPGGSMGDPATLVDASRALIRTGMLDLVVRSVPDAADAVRREVAAVDGFVSDSSLTGTGSDQTARLTLRVPEDHFAGMITTLEGLAVEVRSSSTSSQDVTQEVTDVEATLANLRAVEAQYVQLLSRAGTITEVLQVQERLNQVRLQIDRTEARRKSLASQSAMSTLTVELRSVAVAGSGRLAAVSQAWAASLRTLDAIATGALVVLVFSWWLIPLIAAAGWLVARRLRRPTPGGAPPGPEDAP
jgi:hypothetical protein